MRSLAAVMLIACGPQTQPAAVTQALGGAPPPGTTTTWQTGTCDGAVFTGCAQQNQPICTDWGGAGYTNWNTTEYNICAAACQAPNGPSSYCTWQPASCGFETFHGCAQLNQPDCTDFGGAWYPSWKQSDWDDCAKACALGNRSDWCTWNPPSHEGWAHNGPGQEFWGCSTGFSEPCSDWGGSQYPNWTPALGDRCAQICTSNCPYADPNDYLPDDDALNTCLRFGGTLKLSPGYPGYIVAKGLVITQDNTTITSTMPGFAATFIADAYLAQPILAAPNPIANLNISRVIIDGNRASRNDITCSGYRGAQSNVVLSDVNGGSFSNSRSTGTLCGSSFGFHGDNFTIQNSLFDNNGVGREGPSQASEPWSDGITLGLCANTTVANNVIIDATDVAIVDGGGEGCTIRDNIVGQVSRHAFAGIQFGLFGAEGNGDHVDSVVSGNQVSGAGLMSFGLMFGAGPWGAYGCLTGNCTDGGTMSGNTASGAVVNLDVDGVVGATVNGNTLSAPRDLVKPQCGGAPKNYAVGRAYGSTLDPGYVSENYSPSCIP